MSIIFVQNTDQHEEQKQVGPKTLNDILLLSFLQTINHTN